MLSCEYGVTLKAPVLKNICERLLLNGRHWYFTNQILKFYYWDKMKVFLFSFSCFLLGLFVRLFWEGSRAISPEEFYLPTLGQTLTLTRGQFSFSEIVWLFPTLKLTLILIQTPTLTDGQLSLGGNCPDTNFLLRNLYIYARNIGNIVDVWSSF